MQDDELLLETRRFCVVRRTQPLPGGGFDTRELILHPGAVTIVPLIEANKVLLIRNRRLAVNDTLWELPAGTLEPGEEPAETACRELAEETGYRAGEISLLHSFWMSPGILRERMHLFVARRLSRGKVHLDIGEQIEPCIVAWNEALEMARSGQIQDAKTLVGLLWCDRWQRQPPR